MSEDTSALSAQPTALTMRTLQDMDVRGKVVLVRVDFNVPLSKSGQITDDTRIRSTLPTLQRLLEMGASKLVLASHLGRPKGPDPALSLAPVAARLSELLDTKIGARRAVSLLPHALDKARELVCSAPAGSVLLLENTRFHPGEERNDSQLAAALASLADAYVNDAFGAAHRAHASTVGIARLLPAAAGLLMEREVRELRRLLEAPRRPFVAVLGGAKVSDKIDVIRNLLPRVDHLLIGGAMANTFLLAQGKDTGKSLVEPDKLALARELLQDDNGGKITLPVDVVVAESLGRPETATTVPVDDVPPDSSIYDIGPDTASAYSRLIQAACTVFWNGPMGVFENERFSRGTIEVARAVAGSDAYSVVGGGDSVAALESAGLADRIDHVSTGGGASLELLEGRVLPGVAALEPTDA